MASKRQAQDGDTMSVKVFPTCEILMSDIPQPQWLIDDWWLAGAKGIVAGAPKTFKSTLVLDFAFSIATSKPFCGQPTNGKPKRVLYIQREMSMWALKDRVARIVENKINSTNTIAKINAGVCTFHPFEFDVPVYFTDPEAQFNPTYLKTIPAIAKDMAIDLVVIDPLYSFTQSDLFSNSEVSPLLAQLDAIAATGSAVIVVHHNNKAHASNKAINPSGGSAMAGSVYLHGWTECAWFIQKGKQTHGP